MSVELDYQIKCSLLINMGLKRITHKNANPKHTKNMSVKGACPNLINTG